MRNDSLLRIGELSRRTGVSPEVLRAWERRYGLFSPARTEGGFRLYSSSDVARIHTMKRLLSEGLSASEAAAQVRDRREAPAGIEPVAAPASLFEQRLAPFRAALLAYDESAAQAAIDHLLMEFDVETVMRHAFLPVLREIGERWAAGDVSVAQEHFGSQLIRRRLSGLARGWEEGAGPRAILACPPGEDHDIPLMMFGIALGNRGWRITYLGARTPDEQLEEAVRDLQPQLVVLSSPEPGELSRITTTISGLTSMTRVAIGGAGATQSLADASGAILLDGDPIAGADAVVASLS